MNILFVCTGNACRSPTAEALFKKFNSEVRADSAGTNAYFRIVDTTRNYLRKHGAECYLKQVPHDLYRKNLKDYDLIVAMEQKHKSIILTLCPECAEKIVVWNIDDPYKRPLEDAERIFDQIRNKVEKLAGSLTTP